MCTGDKHRVTGYTHRCNWKSNNQWITFYLSQVVTLVPCTVEVLLRKPLVHRMSHLRSSIFPSVPSHVIIPKWPSFTHTTIIVSLATDLLCIWSSTVRDTKIYTKKYYTIDFHQFWSPVQYLVFTINESYKKQPTYTTNTSCCLYLTSLVMAAQLISWLD